MRLHQTVAEALEYLSNIRDCLKDVNRLRQDDNYRHLFLISVSLLGEKLTVLRDACNEELGSLQAIQSRRGQWPLIHDFIGFRNVGVKRCRYEAHLGKTDKLEQMIESFQKSDKLLLLETRLEDLLEIKNQDLFVREAREMRRLTTSVKPPSGEANFTAADYTIMIMKEVECLEQLFIRYITIEYREYEECANSREIYCKNTARCIQENLERDTTSPKGELMKLFGYCTQNLCQMINDWAQVMLATCLNNNNEMLKYLIEDCSRGDVNVSGQVLLASGLAGRSGRHFIEWVDSKDVDSISENVVYHVYSKDFFGRILSHLFRHGVCLNYFDQVETESGRKWIPKPSVSQKCSIDRERAMQPGAKKV
jgi:hypothetical protein